MQQWRRPTGPHLPLGHLGRASGAGVVTALDSSCLLQIEGRLARYKTPKRVIFVEELPRNAMGKVQKAALREAYKDIYRD